MLHLALVFDTAKIMADLARGTMLWLSLISACSHLIKLLEWKRLPLIPSGSIRASDFHLSNTLSRVELVSLRMLFTIPRALTTM